MAEVIKMGDIGGVMAIIGVIAFALFIGWLATIHDDNTTLKTYIDDYQELTVGTASENTAPSLNNSGSVSLGIFGDIPILGSILSFILSMIEFIVYIVSSIFTYIGALLGLSALLPGFMQPILALGVLAFFSIIYIVYIKNVV